MLPGMELLGCTGLAVPPAVMQHVVKVESSFNRYAIGVVGGRLARQPRSLPEALSTARMLEERGYNFSLGLAQVNRHNLTRQGLDSYEKAFDVCPNLQAGSRILAECYTRSGNDWGKAFSCYYSGNFTTGYRHGYVQKVFASWQGEGAPTPAIPVIDRKVAPPSRTASHSRQARAVPTRVARRIEEARSEELTALATAAIRTERATTPAPAAMAGAPPAQATRSEAPVVVQSNQQNTAVAPPASPVVQTSGRDEAFVF